MRNTLINIGLLVTSIIFFFGAVEFALRLTGLVQVGPRPPLIYRTSANAAISYELIPNTERKAYRSTVRTNSLGFRSEERDDSRPLIAVLGDSVTFGYGVENDETIAAQLEKHLPQYQFLNAGIPGYHLGQEAAVYREKIAALRPTDIILVFHPNDMTTETGWLDEDGVLRGGGDDPTDRPALRCNPIEEGLLGFLPGRCWLDRNSAIYNAMKKVVILRSGRERLEEEQEQSAKQPEVDSIRDEHLRAYGVQLREFAQLLPDDARRIFVLWPDREVHAVSRPKIRALAKRNGFTVVDLYDTFGNTAQTLAWDTVHPSPETIARAAEVIAATFNVRP
jgi:lysophospholipase L1-like esterase